MSIIALTDISHYFGDDCIMKGVSFSVEEDRRIGLIGSNGTGKTTLLEIISGRIQPGGGTVHKKRDAQISYLHQEFEEEKKYSLLNYVLHSHRRVAELSTLIKLQEQKLQYDHSTQNMRLLDCYQAEFNALEGYSIEYKAKIILQQLSFPEAEWGRDINSFSGGEKTRIQLAASLIAPAELLLLDEPTNHLDIKMRSWLEKYLNELSIPYIIVSHDRYFLEKTVSTILSFENKTIVSYSGSYSLFEREYLLKLEQQKKAFLSQQEYIEKTEDFIRKNLAGQKTKQAQSRRKNLQKLERLERPQTSNELQIAIKSSKRSGNIVFTMEGVSFGYPGKTLGEDITQTIVYRDRIALLGENGCGKTTFLQMLIKEKRPLAGKIMPGTGITIGYYDQLHINLNPELSIRETISYEHPDWVRYQVLSFLAAYGFYEEEIEKKINILSGGEKARLYLALLISRKPNVLMMDEPTNHLDIGMIRSLEKALLNYEGTLIFVSHDRYFIDNIADRIWLFKDNNIKETDRWEELLLSEKQSADIKKSNEKKREKPKQRKINPIVMDKKLEKIEALEALLSVKENELTELGQLYLKKETYSDGDKVKNINDSIQSVKEEIFTIKNELIDLEDDYLQCLEEE